ncbi:MAG: helix-turn-helix domain-containing protein [Kofleriaceae bacterium]
MTGTNTTRGGLVSAVERAARVSGRRTPTDGVPDDVVRARDALSTWLVAGREARGLARAQVARTTRIPVRTLENLEDGRWDELPADVFVRGFLRSYARCVGLSVDEVLVRYAECGFAAAPVASAHARALLDTMSALAPTAAARPTTRPVTATPVTSAPRILGTGEFAAVAAPDEVEAGAGEASEAKPLPVAPRSTHPRAATVRPAVEPTMKAAGHPKPRRAKTVDGVQPARAKTVDGQPSARKTKRAATVPGTRERDARGRFIRRTDEMAAVTLDAELQAIADSFEQPAPTVAFTPVTASPVIGSPVIEPPPTGGKAAAVPEAAGGEAAAVFEASGGEAVAVSEASGAEAAAVSEAASGAEASAGPQAAAATELATEPSPIEAVAPATTMAPSTGTVTRVMAPRASRLIAAPSLVIDDDNPEDAESAREERAQARDGGWRSFLPPALLDQERGSRQGGLTLAVIILLIVATLTLSYLMRRPGSAGEGITALPTAGHVG